MTTGGSIGGIAAYPRAQFLLTTHSEQVIGSVPAGCVRKIGQADGEIVSENVPFAQGATGERILIDLMGAHERVPGEVTALLERYVEIVDGGEGEGQQAKELRSQLEQAIHGDERLHQADLEIARHRIMARLTTLNP